MANCTAENSGDSNHLCLGIGGSIHFSFNLENNSINKTLEKLSCTVTKYFSLVSIKKEKNFVICRARYLDFP